VDEVAVMGLDDIEWGQSVFALVALKPDWKLRFMNEDKFTLEDLKKWLRPRLPKHCMPKSFKKIDQIPRNNMGKINKRDLIKIYQK
jgi:malonyl-CoA/methylmalonyl-CoA synthetase